MAELIVLNIGIVIIFTLFIQFIQLLYILLLFINASFWYWYVFIFLSGYCLESYSRSVEYNITLPMMANVTYR